MLEELIKHNKTLCVATSKPLFFAEQILEHFNIAQYFKIIMGSNMDGTHTEKNEVIQEILNQLPDINTSNIIMVGDRKYDVIGAKHFGIDTASVLYGFGSLEELQLEEPTHIVNTVNELKNLLTRL